MHCINNQVIDCSKTGVFCPRPFNVSLDIECAYEMRQALLRSVPGLCRLGFQQWLEDPQKPASGWTEPGSVEIMGFAASMTQNIPYIGVISSALTEFLKIQDVRTVTFVNPICSGCSYVLRKSVLTEETGRLS